MHTPRLLLPLLAAALALGGCHTDPIAVIEGRAPATTNTSTALNAGPFRTLPIGLCEDYPEETRTLDQAREDLDLLASLGVTNLRISLGWDGIEPRQGEYDWAFWDAFVRMADQRAIELHPYLCYTPDWAAASGNAPAYTRPPRDPADFAAFARAAASRYARSIDTWELWNEPDNPAYWTGSPAQYADLITTAARAIRDADPTSRVVLGGIAWDVGYIEKTLQQPGVAQTVDIVNLHAYFETWTADPAETLSTYLARAADITAAHAEAEPLWLAEVGYSTLREGPRVSDHYRARHPFEHTLEHHADNLLKTVAMAAARPEVRLLAWYELRDLPRSEEVIGDNNNRHLGLFTIDGRAKPALDAFQFARALFSTQPFRPDPGTISITTASHSTAQARCFERPDGSAFAVLWVPTRHHGDLSPASAQPPAETITLSRDRLRAVRVYDAEGRQLPAPRRSGPSVSLAIDHGDTLVVELQ